MLASASQKQHETRSFPPHGAPPAALPVGSRETPGQAAATTAKAHRDEEGEPAIEVPASIGRYRVERLLGQGGFGLVFLAHDEQLDRQIAVKVPHARLIERPEDAELYLAEARTVALLDHPHIVPVYDVGGTAERPCFIVSKYVEGRASPRG